MNEKKVREAIEAFQGQVDWLKRIDDKECEESRRCCIEYFETAIEALEKQFPKKPVLKRNAYGGISVCPICGASDYGKYCRQCGQRIDREEEE